MIEGLPPHRIRESARARRVLLRFSHSAGLEVVVPRGFTLRDREVAELLREHALWIERATRKFSVPPRVGRAQVPTKLELRAIDLSLAVERASGPGSTVRLIRADNIVRLSGNTANRELCRRALARFLRELAVDALLPLLASASRRTGLSYRRAGVRTQKTRWGSYSSRGTVSLNAKLLFLPRRLVEYVILHELCHSRHLNHGPLFQELLTRLEPESAALDRELRAWESRVPRWMHP